jgi:hypothetical protein
MSLEASWRRAMRASAPSASRRECRRRTPDALPALRAVEEADEPRSELLRAQMDLRASHVRTYRVRASVRAHLRAATHVCMRTV